jgi:exodeoxyribonuclease V beta subunit
MTIDFSNEDFPHKLVIEASAGTGKTYSVAAIVTLELALNDDLRLGQILITTFTRNAAAELRDRVRGRLLETLQTLRGEISDPDDPVAARLLSGTATEILARMRRLERALVEFDTATISTIHGVCSRVLRMAGLEAGSIADVDESNRIVAEAVNDLVVSQSATGHRWDEKRLTLLVEKLREDPFLEPWIDPDFDDSVRSQLEELRPLLKRCVDRIQQEMTAAPSYNDLLRIARTIICDESRGDLLAALRARFKLAIVDEAQDTDRQQWEFFNRLFPGNDGRRLISVGDPKQAIYSFRGADVQAYVRHTRQPEMTHRSLDTNFRSDQPLLAELNRAFADREFGAGIAYVEVHAPQHHQQSKIQGMPGSVEFLDLGVVTNQNGLAKPVLGKVIELLDQCRLADTDSPAAEGGLLEPNDICVLVRSGGVGRLIQRALIEAGIPAVTGGTSSVMASSMALDFRSLLEAMERPSDLGRVRRAAATVFFGHSLVNVGALLDEDSHEIEQVQEQLLGFQAILTKRGLASLGAAIEADKAVMTRIARGPQGERKVTDFLHLIEVMDANGPGKGCSVDRALAIFSRLETMDEKHDLVARRVESDAAAVKILTIHASKGLQFPCVIVADLWDEEKQQRMAGKKPAVFYDDDIRKLDLGFAVGAASAHAAARKQAADCEESQRLLYVATTRAEHYLAVLVARIKQTENNPNPQSILEQTMTLPDELAQPNGLERLTRSLAPQEAGNDNLQLAPPPTVTRTFRRMSFTGITAMRGRDHHRAFEPEISGYDESPSTGSPSLPALPETATKQHDVVDLPAGIMVGRVVHEIFEHVDTQQQPLTDEVRRVVTERATSGRLRSAHDSLVTVVSETLATPLGGPFGKLTLGSIPPVDRLAELSFEMGLASLTAGIRARAIGELLRQVLPKTDLLYDYAGQLANPSFDVPVGGLLTGSIDGLLRLPDSTPDRPRLLITDYKSNKLHTTGMNDPLRAYHPDRLTAAMAEHHYPLQALLYGTAVYRLLRWRLPAVDPDDCIAGVAYAFIRGMKGPNTPTDELGRRYGIFVWQAPRRGLWQQLSDLLVTPQPAGVGA